MYIYIHIYTYVYTSDGVYHQSESAKWKWNPPFIANRGHALHTHTRTHTHTLGGALGCLGTHCKLFIRLDFGFRALKSSLHAKQHNVLILSCDRPSSRDSRGNDVIKSYQVRPRTHIPHGPAARVTWVNELHQIRSYIFACFQEKQNWELSGSQKTCFGSVAKIGTGSTLYIKSPQHLQQNNNVLYLYNVRYLGI